MRDGDDGVVFGGCPVYFFTLIAECHESFCENRPKDTVETKNVNCKVVMFAKLSSFFTKNSPARANVGNPLLSLL